MPTFANITKSKLSQNKIDGKDIWPLLSGEEIKHLTKNCTSITELMNYIQLE